MKNKILDICQKYILVYIFLFGKCLGVIFALKVEFEKYFSIGIVHFFLIEERFENSGMRYFLQSLLKIN